MSQPQVVSVEAFNVAYKALQDTEWIVDPANPVNHLKGLVRRGETIWFHPDHFGSGPAWQQARLQDHSLQYVQLANFKKIASE